MPTSSSSAPTLPIEVIRQIFASLATPLSTAELRQFPWFLGHICSTWRYLFLSMTAEFWDSILIIFFPRGYEQVADVVHFFLEHGTEASFSFNIRSVRLPESNPKVADHIRRTMEMLVDVSERWKKASFDLFTTDLLPLIRAKNRLPLLQELSLSFSWTPGDELHDLPYDVFENAPSLNFVKIGNLAGWRFDFLNLKAIHVAMLGSRGFSFVGALSQMTKLERLRLHCAPGYAMSFKPIVIPNLTALSCYPAWLCFLQTPALEDLSINDCYKSDSGNIVPSFLLRSSCELRVLRLDGASSGAVIDILRYTPRITHLKLVHTGNVGNVLKQLIISTNPAQEPLARQLLSLSLRTSSCANDDDMNLLIDLISSRTDNATDTSDYNRLQELIMSVPSYKVSGITRKKIATLCAERRVQHVDLDRRL